MEIVDIKLPNQTGCEHVHVEIMEDGEKKEMVYHMNDFKTKSIEGDPVFDMIYKRLKAKTLRNREDLINLKGEKLSR